MTAIFILLAVGVQKAEAQWTLEQCIEFATRNNLYIKQMELRQKVAKTDLNAARTALLPNINAGIGQNWNLGRTQTQSGLYENQTQSNTNLSVSSSMTIFAGGRLINSIGKAKLDLQISKANLQKAKNDVSLRVTSLFFDVLLRKELLKIAEEQFRATLYQEKITKTLADNGKIPQSQIFDISAKKAKDTLAIVQADNNIKLALLELILTVEPTDIDGFDIADITPPNAETIDENYREPLPVPQQIYEQALNNKPEIKSATIGVASAQKSLKIAKADYLPTVSLQAGIGTNYFYLYGNPQNTLFKDQIGGNLGRYISITVNIPVFNRLSVVYRTRQAKINIDNQRLILDNTRKQLFKDIHTAYINATMANERRRAAIRAVSAAQEAFRYATKRYVSGKLSVSELTQAQAALVEAQAEEARARYDSLLKTRILKIYEEK